jgi:exodeoxyribonuclease V beta subunit
MNERTVQPFDALTVPLTPGVTLVEASAGTGKTFAITRLVLRLLLERKVEDLSKILVVTFTEKATQELVTRIRAVLRESDRVWSDSAPARTDGNDDLFKLREQFGAGGAAIIRTALSSLDDLAVSTIHGFCHRILAESALESRIPFKTTFLEDDTEPFQRAANDWARKRLIGDSEAAQLVVADETEPAAWVNKLVRPYRRHPGTSLDFDSQNPSQRLLADFATTVDSTFEAEKKRRHLLGFDDLLRKLCDVLTKEGSDGPLATRIRGKFGAALIDEFQDTDPTQYPIFSTAFAGCPLFLIGDPKQSIYGFRGADVHAYLDAAASAERHYTLLRNYRSTPAYVQAVETLFTRAADPFVMSADQIGFPKVAAAKDHELPDALRKDGGVPLEWWWVDGSLGKTGKSVSKEDATNLMARDVANEIVRLHNAGLPCSGMAVLLRTNREALLMKRALDRARIPAVIGGDTDVLSSDEGAELVILATAVAVPHDGWAVRAAMATRLWGSDAEEIALLQRDGAARAWSAVADSFLRAREQWWKRGVAVSLGQLLAERRSAERLLALPDGERRLTNVRHVLELFHEAWSEDGIAPEGFAAWVAREQTVPNTPERRELRLERDAEAVQLLTIHKCKGLQFDVVFCPTLWQSFSARPGPLGVNFALAPDGENQVLDLGSPKLAERLQASDREDRAESVRRAYVALTRAVHRCYVAWGEIGTGNSAADSALGYLLRSDGGQDKRAVLESLVKSSGGQMRIRDVEKDGARLVSREVAAVTASPTARPLALAPHQLDTWRISSFTGVTAGAYSDVARDDEDPIMIPDSLARPADAPGFRGFPGGAGAGVALHALLEGLDFQRVNDADVPVMVRRTLAAHALLGVGEVAERRVNDVTAMLRRLASTQIPGAGFALDRVPRDAGMREWRFDLSVERFSAQRFAGALASHGSAHARAYAPLLAALDESAFAGYLSGFLDLAFEHEGRWWVIDWKSNWLGAEDADYAPAALDGAMREAHYTFQYHLYLVALHRHLRARQRDYDPARHWGGVAYVFLRGVTGQGDYGWFRDEPTPALLDALDAAIGGAK